MTQYTFLQENNNLIIEGIIGDILKDRAMCQRAHNLRERIHKEAIFQIKKIKDFYRQRRINRKTYLKLLDKQYSKLDRLEMRLGNLNLLV